MHNSTLSGWSITSQMLALDIDPKALNALEELYLQRRNMIRLEGEKHGDSEAEIQQRVIRMCNEIGY